jgi:demethylmenaquinone methyltransferase/2-methoxy-6-polyprenyl-1,4-benzoquinol methylase
MTAGTGTLPAEGVRTMFGRIAPVYDAMNHVMTAGLDRRWRRVAAEAVVRPGDRVLDACCGTGDFALADARAGGRVTGLDFSERMLERARAKSSAVEWVQGDALALPFEDGSFDAATVGFGVRNLETWAGLVELRRVLRPGGGWACSRSRGRAGLHRSTALVREGSAAGREGGLRQLRVHLPSGERPPLPGP